jgi:hypothetical protein
LRRRQDWREVEHQEDNKQLNGKSFAGTFAVGCGGECCFIRLVNIGREHRKDHIRCISVWEIFGTIFE